MIYCFNPRCSNPRNPDETRVCYSCGSQLLLGKRYRGVRLIGQGGFGRTFLAEDEAQDSLRRCVIKQFYPEGQPNARTAVQLFEQEARRLQKLGEHPQIPDFYDHLEQEKYQYIVQEFINGENLAQELDEEGHFNESKIRQLLKDILPVLKFLHQGEIIHRDIKPANLIRSQSEEKLFLVDFGAAKHATATALAKTGTIIGSAEYISPEQLRGKSIFASDIYSLGVTCVYLLTQVSPFDLFDITEDTWVWRDYLVNNEVSDELGHVLDKMIKNSIKERYSSVDEIIKDLKMPLVVEANQFYCISPSVNFAPPAWQCVNTLMAHEEPVTALAFHPDGQRLASSSDDGIIKLWSLKTGQKMGTLIGHFNRVTTLVFNPKGDCLLSSGWENLIKVWDWKTRKVISSWMAHDNWVSTLQYSPDGRVLASGSYDKSIKFWDRRTGKEITVFKLRGSQSWVTCLSFHPVQPILASGQWDNGISLWDLKKQQLLNTLMGHIAGVTAMAFSPNGAILASGSVDKSIKLWDYQSGEILHHLKGHDDSITAIAFSPDGRILASSSLDKTVKLWYLNNESWQLMEDNAILTLTEHNSPVRCVRFSPDGEQLASSSNNGIIKLWSLVP